MKSFKEYANTHQEEAAKTSEQTANAEELAKQIAAAYNGKSNMDMLKSILTQAEESKRAGTLSNDEIENFYQNFSPMLNGFKRKKLREIVDELKKI